MLSVKSASLKARVTNRPVSAKYSLNFPRSTLEESPAFGSSVWRAMSTVLESSSCTICSRISSDRRPASTLDTW